MYKLNRELTAKSPDEMFAIGEDIARSLAGGELILLVGGLGAGKTLLTKGIMGGLEFDIDEVTSPSFTLVNRYEATNFDVYHIDLWRLDVGPQVAMAVGLEEIFEDENAVVIVEWADRLGDRQYDRSTTRIEIIGDGDEPRNVSFANV